MPVRHPAYLYESARGGEREIERFLPFKRMEMSSALAVDEDEKRREFERRRKFRARGF